MVENERVGPDRGPLVNHWLNPHLIWVPQLLSLP